MKSLLLSSGLCALGLLAYTPVFGATAVTLSSFEGIEEPTVRYLVPSDSFATGDSYVNITDRGGGVFRFELRFRKGQWWDGDRATTLEDRGRAEVKGLGPHQKVGDTVEYSTTWRTSPNWAASGQFCHIFQLKTTDTNSVMSNIKADINGVARFQNHSQSNDTTPRTWNYAVNSFQTVKLRIKISTTSGLAQASVNGDAFQGQSGGPNYWVGAADYRPKWGLYRKQTNSMNLGDNYVEHSNVQANFGTTTPNPAVAAPTFSPGSGNYSSPQSVTISTVTSGASIRYTTDGSTPTSTTGTPYTGPVTISAVTTLKAIAFKSGSPDSTVSTATYTFSEPGTVVGFEAESAPRTTSGTSATTDSDSAASAGARVTLNSTGTGSWVEFTTPSIPAGTYSLAMAYKTNNNRGILNLKVDGVQIGGTVDQYASSASYPNRTFGTVTFATAGTHKIRLTVTGKNSASSSYTLSADRFVFTGQ